MPNVPIQPVFLLSLPRSGSTLVQRVLAAHPDVATAAEPWVALPQIAALRAGGTEAAYDHGTAARAIEEFARALPGGRDRYLARVRELLEGLYADAAGSGERWFVDKTPRYHLIVEELLALFPEAPFVLLWRNPLDVVASMTATWHDHRWYPYRHGIDLFDGLTALVDAQSVHPARLTVVRYEDLVTGPAAWEPIAGRLGISIDQALLDAGASSRLEAFAGDPSQARTAVVSSSSRDRWRDELASPVRRRWARRYLDWIGDERLARMGYDGHDLRTQLATAPARWTDAPGDVWGSLRERGRAAVRRWERGGRTAFEWGPRGFPD